MCHQIPFPLYNRTTLHRTRENRSFSVTINPLTPNDHYSGRTVPLTSKCFILYIYSTNICTEYFKHGIYCPFFPLQNAVCFIILTYLVPVVFTFYIQGVLKLKKNNSGAKRLSTLCLHIRQVQPVTSSLDLSGQEIQQLYELECRPLHYCGLYSRLT